MTYAPPNMTSEQEVFDFVVHHLHSQNECSMSDDMDGQCQCAYRGTDGNKCAVGCLMADQHYSPALEGISISGNLTTTYAAVRDSLGYSPKQSLLRKLQAVHDFRYPDANWPAELLEVARAEGLRDSVVRECWPDVTPNN